MQKLCAFPQIQLYKRNTLHMVASMIKRRRYDEELGAAVSDWSAPAANENRR
jgi:hypothetical protein